MKKFITLIAALVMAANGLFAETTAIGYVTKNYNLKDFTGITAGGIVSINLVKSDNYKVEITLPAELEEYLTVRVSGGDLKISLSSVPARITKRLKDWNMTAEIAMPELIRLELSGANNLRTDDTFDLKDKGFRLEVSGASKVNGLNIMASELVAELSGATYVNLAGGFDVARIDMAGAAKGAFNIDAGKLKMEASGASKPTIKGEFDTIDLEISGASDFNWTGSARKMDVEASGASKVRTSGCPVEEVRLDLSGASKCDVNAVRYLGIEASGASDVHYVANPNLELDLISVARGASISKTR